MTPRRSSSARNQPSPAVILQHTNSAGSSTPMTRERSTRSNHKTSSPTRSLNRSHSIDDGEGSLKSDFPQTRLRQRARENQFQEHEDEAELDDEDVDEEEITRCLCGQQDYPGLPPSRREALGRERLFSSKADSSALMLSPDSSDVLSDDIGSMFIQCDSCKVWQHGGCVGIMDEAMSPEEYFCEECRKDLHRIRIETNGQYSSQYLPVVPASPPASSSRESSRENSKRARGTKSRHGDNTMHPPKRRSTMNSREAAYDEEEQLRRAIEESKEDTTVGADNQTSKRAKRSRSDSEINNKQAAKRQRTSSPYPVIVIKPNNVASNSDSEDESKMKTPVNGTTKQQKPATRDPHEKDMKSVEVEIERGEAHNRRKGRSDKRKGVDSDNETGTLSKAVNAEAERARTTPDKALPSQEPTPARPATRKSGRSVRRGNRVGRNQYTRDRDVNGNGTDSNSPRRGQSQDGGGDSPNVGGVNGTHGTGGESGKPSRPRYMNPHRTSMNEMKRRVAGILEFISHMQVEMATAAENSSTPVSNGERVNGTLVKSVTEQLEVMVSSTASDGADSAPSTEREDSVDQPTKEKEFKDLSSVEMMDVLTRHLLKWQQEYGKFGEK